MKAGHGKAIYKEYIGVINNYLIPALGKRVITNVDYTSLNRSSKCLSNFRASDSREEAHAQF